MLVMDTNAMSIARIAACMLAIGVGWVTPAWAEHPPIRITEFGAYTVAEEHGTADPSYAATGISALRLVSDPTFIEHTDRIEARLCRRFGVLYQVDGADPDSVPVVVRVTHPLIVRPDGEQAKEETWNSTAVGTPSIAGFAFAETWELMPGNWTFEVLVDGEVAAAQQFRVVPARAGAPPLEGCEAPVS